MGDGRNVTHITESCIKQKKGVCIRLKRINTFGVSSDFHLTRQTPSNDGTALNYSVFAELSEPTYTMEGPYETKPNYY